MEGPSAGADKGGTGGVINMPPGQGRPGGYAASESVSGVRGRPQSSKVVMAITF